MYLFTAIEIPLARTVASVNLEPLRHRSTSECLAPGSWTNSPNPSLTLAQNEDVLNADSNNDSDVVETKVFMNRASENEDNESDAQKWIRVNDLPLELHSSVHSESKKLS